MISRQFKTSLIVCAMTIAFSACPEENVSEQTPLRLLRGHEVTTPLSHLVVSIYYNQAGVVQRIDWTRETPNVTEGSDVYTFDNEGKAVELLRSISGLNDERITFTYEGDKIIGSEHFVNGDRIAYILYDYDQQGRLVHSERSDRVIGAGHSRGGEKEYAYDANGNLVQLKEYRFNESSAQLELKATYSWSSFSTVHIHCSLSIRCHT